MKLIVTATGPELKAAVDPRFGRGAYFVTVDTETLQWKVQANAGVNAGGGAGAQAAQFAAQQGAQVVISGDFGPNAHEALTAAGIDMYLLGSSKTVWDAVSNYTAGRLAQVGAPTAAGHHGA